VPAGEDKYYTVTSYRGAMPRTVHTGAAHCGIAAAHGTSHRDPWMARQWGGGGSRPPSQGLHRRLRVGERESSKLEIRGR
jgi:hypothetical protein